MDILFIALPLVTAFVVTTLSVPVSLFFIKKWGLVDDPKTHHHPALLHTKPIPRGGGIPLFMGIVVAGILFLPITKITIVLFCASLFALIIGTLDDKFDISRYIRFCINILCALIVVCSGITIPFITNPLGGILHLTTIPFSFPFFHISGVFPLAGFITVIWIVWVMNMLNWSKGVDGQMPGIIAISAFVIGLLSLRFPLTEPSTVIAAKVSFMITGASLGFLIFNFYPAKIFPGYGATAIYLLLSVVSFLSGAKLATAFLVMGIPMIDGIFTIIRRLLAGRSPFWHDKRHLHHLLLKLGYGQRQIALFYWIVSGILGGVSLMLSSKGKIFAIVMLAVVVTGGLLFLHITLRENKGNK